MPGSGRNQETRIIWVHLVHCIASAPIPIHDHDLDSCHSPVVNSARYFGNKLFIFNSTLLL